MNKVALKKPRIIKILNILKITIIASKPLNLAMLGRYLGFFFLVIVKIFGHFRGFQDNLVIFDMSLVF